MTCELYLIGQPENSGTDTHTIPAGNTAQLSFGAANIKGMQLDGDGGLIVMLEDGGQVIVDNYEAFACEEHNLTLSDGTVVDLDTLSTSFQTAESLFGQFDVHPPIDNIIDKPSENEIAEIALNHGEKYVCNFDPETLNQAMVEVVDGNMILNFADGSQIVFSDFVELIDGELPPELTLADGTVIDSDELLIDVANIEESLENIEPASGNEEPSTEDLAALAEELADIETAAGEGGSSNSGFGFGSSFSSTEFNSPDDIGALGATSLNYDAPNFSGDNRLIDEDTRPEISVENEFLDETSLLLGPIERTGQVNVDFGGDGAGAISSNGSFSFGGSVQNNQLTSQGEPITIIRTSNGYEGVADGEITFEFTIQPNGEYSFIQHASIDHGDPNNQNETLTLNFGVRAVDSDGDVSNSAVAVTIADDAPIILSQISATVDETDMTGIGLFTVGQFNVDMGQDINETGAFSTNGEFVVSGSVDNNQLSSNGVSIAVTATDTGYIGVAGDLIVFELNIDPDTGSYGYQQFAGIDHADASDPNDSLSLHFGLQVTDSDGDSAGGFVTINVHDDGVDAADDFSGAEEDQFISGNVLHNDDLSNDGPNTITSIIYNDVTYGPGEEFDTEFGTFSIDANGVWSYQTTAEDPNGTENFVYTLQDSDGDTDTATLSIRVTPDGEPILVTGDNIVDETALANGPVRITGDLDIDAGEDGIGTIEANGQFNATGSLTNLTHEGTQINVTQTSTGYIGLAGDVEVFRLDINDNGTYDFTLSETLDHAGTLDPNDVIQLDFEFGVTLTDPDGDSVDGTVTINVFDDAPVALGDGERAVQEGNAVTGNVRDNDIDSQDDFDQGFSAVNTVTFGGVDYNMPENGTLTVQGNQGTLTINIDGSYTYTAANDGTSGTDSFSYTLIDSDGDRDTADISFNVDINNLPTAVNDTFNVGLLDPNGDAIGNILSNDDFGADGAGSPRIVSFSYDGQTVSAGESIDTGLGIVSILSDGSITLDRPEAIVSVDRSTSTQNLVEVPFTVDTGRFQGSFSDFVDITTTTITTTTNVPGGSLNLTYIIQDSDGDQDSAQVIINLEEGNDTDVSTTQSSTQARLPGSPLVLDLDGDGIELANENDGILFDIDVDGELEQTGFVAADDGLLAIDRNNDGVISNRDELFGDTRGFNDGFENLATFDSNQDGVVDKNDDAFGELLIFQDVNQDGVSQEDELHSLEDIGIASIDVGNYFETDYHINDQFIGFESTFSFDDGTEGVVVDAFFNYYEVNDSGGTEVFSYSGVDALTSFGQEVNVIYDDATSIYQGIAGGDIVFNIQVSENGEYNFNLFSPLDNDGADIELRFGNGDNAIDISVTQDDINNLLSETDPSVWMGAIQEGAQSLAEISEGDGATDFSFVVDNGDDITESIQEWVHSDDNDDTFVSDNNASDANEGNSAMFDVVATDLPALAEDNGSII